MPPTGASALGRSETTDWSRDPSPPQRTMTGGSEPDGMREEGAGRWRLYARSSVLDHDTVQAQPDVGSAVGTHPGLPRGHHPSRHCRASRHSGGNSLSPSREGPVQALDNFFWSGGPKPDSPVLQPCRGHLSVGQPCKCALHANRSDSQVRLAVLRAVGNRRPGAPLCEQTSPLCGA